MTQTIVSASWILVCDERESTIEQCGVLIDDGVIRRIDRVDVLRAEHPNAEHLDGEGCVLLPGWINCHAHLAMNMFRGLTDDVTLEVFLQRLVAAEFETLTPEVVAMSARAAMAESLLGGTTGALDMYYFHEATRQVAADIGFRVVNGPTFLGQQGIDGTPFADLVEQARAELTAIAQAGGTPWIMPHSAYTLTREQLAELAALARETGARIHTHCAESPGEMQLAADQHNARPLSVLDDAGLVGEGTVLAHMVQTIPDEYDRLRESGAFISHCPGSNLKLACGFAPVAQLLAAGVNVGIGTDGAASAGALDMLFNVRLATLLGKGTTRDPVEIPAMRAIRLATADAARALGMADVGRVEVGMRADLQLVDLGTLAAAPLRDPAAALVYSASRRDVRHVFVDGRIVVRDGELISADIDRITADLATVAERAAIVVDRLAAS